MIPVEFDYVRAGSVDDAVSTLRERGEDAKVKKEQPAAAPAA